FIGSQVARSAIQHLCDKGFTFSKLVLFDKLTYAGYLPNIEELINHIIITFVQGDITDHKLTLELLRKFEIDGVMNLAAESHVDNSITGSKPFIETNILGTYFLLEAAREYWSGLKDNKKSSFRFLHISTDEVF